MTKFLRKFHLHLQPVYCTLQQEVVLKEVSLLKNLGLVPSFEVTERHHDTQHNFCHLGRESRQHISTLGCFKLEMLRSRLIFKSLFRWTQLRITGNARSPWGEVNQAWDLISMIWPHCYCWWYSESGVIRSPLCRGSGDDSGAGRLSRRLSRLSGRHQAREPPRPPAQPERPPGPPFPQGLSTALFGTDYIGQKADEWKNSNR